MHACGAWFRLFVGVVCVCFRRCLITDDLARSTPVGQRLVNVEHELSVPNHCQIIVFMLLTRAQGDSFFQVCFCCLHFIVGVQVL